jgi:hypothetical protein
MSNSRPIYQFLPEKFNYLTKSKTIQYKEINLKTAYLINIIHELILKFYFINRNYLDAEPNKDIKFNLWSAILRKKYGMHYNYYMDYLIENNFIEMISDYFVGKKAKTYKINTFDIQTVKRVQIYDTILSKKNTKDYLIQTITGYCNSPINPKLRKRLIDDLYKVQLDYDKSLDYLNKLKESGNIELNKYYKNLHSIDSIKTNYLFFKFDEYGRLHTNFTILKKEIRQKYLKINDEDITEIDIGNSQPLFLALLIKNELDPSDPEISNYIWLAKQGLFYEHFISKFPNLNRKDVKLLTYKVLFGHNGINSIENKMFESLFPKIYAYIIEYKKLNENYKSMSHILQKMESDFIFGKVCTEIYQKIPDINLITIHDSIIFPIKYEKRIKEIFDRNKKELFKE